MCALRLLIFVNTLSSVSLLYCLFEGVGVHLLPAYLTGVVFVGVGVAEDRFVMRRRRHRRLSLCNLLLLLIVIVAMVMVNVRGRRRLARMRANVAVHSGSRMKTG